MLHGASEEDHHHAPGRGKVRTSCYDEFFPYIYSRFLIHDLKLGFTTDSSSEIYTRTFFMESLSRKYEEPTMKRIQKDIHGKRLIHLAYQSKAIHQKTRSLWKH